MTIADPESTQDQKQAEEQEQPERPIAYQVSFERLAELDRSPLSILADRRPQSSPSRQSPDIELTNPKLLLDEIAEHAATDDGFIRTEMPMQEIVFRVLLSRRNAPTLLEDLHYELTERWSTPVRPISVTLEGLSRVLDADKYYGFVRVEQEG